ncbi:hypothetical protein SCLCIDRAFT_921560 [Scleroderma citrinum Foug A]|uniref:Uncharacterized protein n=1 Tax=Scleroderma citrinum Foug A TaxID=1036808 RepID=A0A0C3DY19_9AGAM|nr:hypothetical protein SCLCIDRAFT_921560 [Scleroderma citrinum Foug A]
MSIDPGWPMRWVRGRIFNRHRPSRRFLLSPPTWIPPRSTPFHSTTSRVQTCYCPTQIPFLFPRSNMVLDAQKTRRLTRHYWPLRYLFQTISYHRRANRRAANRSMTTNSWTGLHLKDQALTLVVSGGDSRGSSLPLQP